MKNIKEKIIEKKKDKHPNIRRILSKATQHAYEVGEVKGGEYECFYPEMETEINELLSLQKQEIVEEIEEEKKWKVINMPNIEKMDAFNNNVENYNRGLQRAIEIINKP